MHDLIYAGVVAASAIVGTINTISNLRLRATLAEFRGQLERHIDDRYLPRETFGAELKRIEERLPPLRRPDVARG